MPLIDDDSSFSQAVKYLCVLELIAELGIEAPTLADLLR